MFYQRYVPPDPAERLSHEIEERKHGAVLTKYTNATKVPESKAPVPSKDVASSPGQPDQISYGLTPLPQPIQNDKVVNVSVKDALPRWMRQPLIIPSKPDQYVRFAELPLGDACIKTLANKGFECALPIQSGVIPLLSPGSQRHDDDLCISARTGSGKTLAYALPMVEALRGRCGHVLRGLIVVPTRELVSQAKKTLEECASGTDLIIATATGSRSLSEEQKAFVSLYQRYDPEGYKAELKKEIDEDAGLLDWDFDAIVQPREIPYPDHVIDYRSNIDILISTPGRLVEHIKTTKGFTLERVLWLVIDEADKLLDESFQEWVDVVMPGIEHIPPLTPLEQKLQWSALGIHRREVRKIILSATMTRDVSKLMALKLRRPKLVVLQGTDADMGEEKSAGQDHDRMELPDTLKEVAVKVREVSDKLLHLVKLLEAPINSDLENVEPSLIPIPGVTTSQQNPDDDEMSIDDSTSTSSSNVSSDDPDSEDHPKPPPNNQKPPPNNQKPPPNNQKPPPNNQKPPPTHGTLIFTNSTESALRLLRLLTLLKPDFSSQVANLTKSSSAKATAKAIRAFTRRKTSILIASDRASRGLDIENLAHVINYDMPKSVTTYVHRVGRTARAGRNGRATTLVADYEARWFWNEIGRGAGIGRGSRKIQRVDQPLIVSKEDRQDFEDAVGRLGEEATGKKEAKRKPN